MQLSLHGQMQDDMSIKWRKRKKHFFIISHAGKPIYSRFAVGLFGLDCGQLILFESKHKMCLDFAQIRRRE
jgi:hypothetical protein